MFWIFLLALVVMAGTCETMALIHERREQWPISLTDIWWLKLVSNVSAICIGVLLMFIHGGALS